MDARLEPNPLLELQKRSHSRGACDSEGRATGFPTPWAFTLATNGKGPGAPPAIRSLGFQVVNADGIVFIVRGAPGGASGCDYAADTPVSICHLAGNYPGAGFEEQWRAEGPLRELSFQEWSDLMKGGTPSADAHSLEGQFVACDEFEDSRARASGSLDPVDASGRLYFKDAAEVATLDKEVRQRTADIDNGRLGARDIVKAGLRIYQLRPSRVEVLCGGPRWPQGPSRYEWTYAEQWEGPIQILPYSLPEKACAPAPLGGALVCADGAVDITGAADEHMKSILQEFNLTQAVQVEADQVVTCILQNTGRRPWPKGTGLKLIAGTAACGIAQVDFDEIAAGELVQATFQVGASPSHWALASPCGEPFGCLLQVLPPA